MIYLFTFIYYIKHNHYDYYYFQYYLIFSFNYIKHNHYVYYFKYDLMMSYYNDEDILIFIE
jgi:hypothetical protein